MGTTPSNPEPHRPKTNRIGLTVMDYKGGKTTLCAGCGHNAISERIIESMYEMGVQPELLIKPSGIGCSSKTPAYFLSRSHSFNAVHGRMPSVATGAMLANRKLVCIGVSGDGDTASIGIGQFVHLMRRNLPIIYIIEDNGVYGLTKGQFSATADLGSKLKTGVVNDLPPIDTCALAIQLGATLVGRSFSGDKRQLSAMLKAAIAHKGTVMLDVVSPCVTFNDHEGSTKSYKYVKEHEETLQDVSFVPHFEEIDVEYDPGTTVEVTMHDGSRLALAQAGRGLRSHRQDSRHHPPHRGPRQRRSADGHFLRKPRSPQLHRHAQRGGPAAGDAARFHDASGQRSARRLHGRTALEAIETQKRKGPLEKKRAFRFGSSAGCFTRFYVPARRCVQGFAQVRENPSPHLSTSGPDRDAQAVLAARHFRGHCGPRFRWHPSSYPDLACYVA